MECVLLLFFVVESGGWRSNFSMSMNDERPADRTRAPSHFENSPPVSLKFKIYRNRYSPVIVATVERSAGAAAELRSFLS
jgi:hypothetical protein